MAEEVVTRLTESALMVVLLDMLQPLNDRAAREYTLEEEIEQDE